MVPADVALEDFARAGVADVGAIGVLDGRSQIADYAVARILHRHGGVALGPLLGADGVLPTGLFKGFLPVVDTLNEVGAPALGRGRINIVDDGLLGLDEFARSHLAPVLVALGLQAPAADELLALDALLVVGILREGVGEIAHTRVEIAAQHGHIGQEDEAHVEAEGHTSGRGGRGVGRTARNEGFDHLHLHVAREALDVLNIRKAAVDARHRELLLGALGKAQGGSVLQEELVDLDLAGLVFVLRNLEEADDGILVGHRHGARNALRGVGHVDGHAGAKHQHAIRVQLPKDGLLL